MHGVYKPGNVVLRPELLKELNEGVGAKYGKAVPVRLRLPRRLRLHGARRSRTALENGVVKMNIDTDTQYAFTRPVADHMFQNYDGVLKVDGEVGNKKTYDPRTWGKLAEASHGRARPGGLRQPALDRHEDQVRRASTKYGAR